MLIPTRYRWKAFWMNHRRLLPAVLCALTLGPGSLHAQEPRNAILIDLFLPVMSPVSHLSGEDMAFVPLNIKYQRVLTEHGVLGGLVKDIRAFHDSANDIGGDPERSNLQIARHWLEASERHGMPVKNGFPRRQEGRQ